MFDWYVPDPKVLCPACGTPVVEWQGKDGPNASFVWQQQCAAPVSQRADEDCRLSDEQLQQRRLPKEFIIYPTEPCCRGCPTHAIGRTTHDVWAHLELPSS
jgi:hypothetical protein